MPTAWTTDPAFALMSGYALMEDLREGDLLFIAVDHWIYRRAAQAANSWAGHVGLVFNEGGRWVVYEAAAPRARITPLEEFLGRSHGGAYAQCRLVQDLSADQIARLKDAAARRLGAYYNFGYNFDSPRQYGAKFVYQVYQDALGVEIGTLQRVGDLMRHHPVSASRYWRLWFLGLIPKKRRIITPSSQLGDRQLRVVAQYPEPGTPKHRSPRPAAVSAL